MMPECQSALLYRISPHCLRNNLDSTVEITTTDGPYPDTDPGPDRVPPDPSKAPMCPSIYPAARLLAAARVLGPPGLSLPPALWTPQNKNTMYPASNTGRWFLRAHRESGLDPQGHSPTLRWHARCHCEEIILHTQTCQNIAMSLQVNGLWCFGITCIVWNTVKRMLYCQA
jgi:hypothetical protein